jgi:hypothetical protein
MPWPTTLVVFGSWILLLVLTLVNYAFWSERIADKDEDGS